MLKVGLTGSIAVGKTYVCDVFRELGCFVSDADQISRQVVEPHTPGWQLIVANFGKEVLQSDDTLNRAKMGSIVFADEAKRQLLNSILHPLINEAQDQWLRERGHEAPDGIAIIDAALMIESGGYKRFDKLIVVWCGPEVQIERLMNRNNLSRADAVERIKTQMTQEEKKSFADYTIDTSGGFQSARVETVKVFRELKSLPANDANKRK